MARTSSSPSLVRIAEIHENAKEFEARLLQEKLESMKQLAYGASHEINNPLANISTRAQSLMAGEFNPERRRKLAINFSRRCGSEMISDMMLFAHPPSIKPEHVDVYDIARDVLEKCGPPSAAVTQRPTLGHTPTSTRSGSNSTQISVAFKALVRNSLEAILRPSRTVNAAESSFASGQKTKLYCRYRLPTMGLD